MSPYEIKLLMDIYSVVGWSVGHTEPIFDETVDKFFNHGLIDADANITEKGRAHVIQICNLLYPTKQRFWSDQFGNKIQDTI